MGLSGVRITVLGEVQNHANNLNRRFSTHWILFGPGSYLISVQKQLLVAEGSEGVSAAHRPAGYSFAIRTDTHANLLGKTIVTCLMLTRKI